jgi:multidrug resistance efflux pump
VQEVDKAEAAEARDLADIAVAEARYAEAQRGPTVEERALADATVAAAEAARHVVEARAAKMLLRAPSSGVIAIPPVEIGKVVVLGVPVLTMVPDNGLWQKADRFRSPRDGPGTTGRRSAVWNWFGSKGCWCTWRREGELNPML